MSKFLHVYSYIMNNLINRKSYVFQDLEKPLIINNYSKYSIKNLPLIEIKDTDKIPNIFSSTNIINESKYSYSIKLLKHIYQSSGFLNPVSKKTILKNLNQNWQYYNLFKQHKQVPIYFFKLSFSNPMLRFENGFYTILNHFGIIIDEFQNPQKYRTISQCF